MTNRASEQYWLKTPDGATETRRGEPPASVTNGNTTCWWVTASYSRAPQGANAKRYPGGVVSHRFTTRARAEHVRRVLYQRWRVDNGYGSITDANRPRPGSGPRLEERTE